MDVSVVTVLTESHHFVVSYIMTLLLPLDSFFSFCFLSQIHDSGLCFSLSARALGAPTCDLFNTTLIHSLRHSPRLLWQIEENKAD